MRADLAELLRQWRALTPVERTAVDFALLRYGPAYVLATELLAAAAAGELEPGRDESA